MITIRLRNIMQATDFEFDNCQVATHYSQRSGERVHVGKIGSCDVFMYQTGSNFGAPSTEHTRERSVVHLRAAETLARMPIGSMCRDGVLRRVAGVIRHHLMWLIASSKNLVAMIAVGIARIFAKSLNTI